MDQKIVLKDVKHSLLLYTDAILPIKMLEKHTVLS